MKKLLYGKKLTYIGINTSTCSDRAQIFAKKFHFLEKIVKNKKTLLHFCNTTKYSNNV